MINPDKYIRKGYVEALNAATGLYVGEDVPKDMIIPSSYILLKSQTKQRTAVSKDCWEWETQIQIDINVEQVQGYMSSAGADDIEEQVITAIENGITVDRFKVKSTILVDTFNMDVETPTISLKRKRVIYQHWLNNGI